MVRPHPLAGFEPSADYRLTGLIDVALRADAALEAYEGAVAALATGGGATAADRYRPLMFAQRWVNEVHAFPKALRRLHDEKQSRQLAIGATEAYERMFPGADDPISLQALGVEGTTVVTDGDRAIMEVRMDDDAALSLLEIAREVVRGVLGEERPIKKRQISEDDR